jgi:hypothetical protein
MIAHALVLAVFLLASSSPAAPPAAPREAAPPSWSAEREALRTLAALEGAEPGIAEVQQAAARAAERAVGEARGFARRARLGALLPRVTAEVRREDHSSRVVGLQGSGEVDYLRLAPATTWALRATWDLGELVAARGELQAAAAAGERAKRRTEAVRRATALFYERRRAQAALLLAPPEAALERAEAELEVERLGAELDALTGGLLFGRLR